MIGEPPRYALATPRFRFAALATFAGRAAIGGDREIAMACFVAARLAGALTGSVAATQQVLRERSANARHWLAALAIPPAARTAAAEVADAAARGDRKGAAGGLERLLEAASAALDEPSAGEMAGLIGELRAA